MTSRTESTAGGKPRYMLMSADSHAGADVWDYKPYLAKEFHDDFDAWAPTFSDPWTAFDDELTYTDNPAIRLGVTLSCRRTTGTARSAWST